MITTFHASIDSLAEYCGVSLVTARSAGYHKKFKAKGNSADISSFVKWARSTGATKRSETEVITHYFGRYTKLGETRQKVQYSAPGGYIRTEGKR